MSFERRLDQMAYFGWQILVAAPEKCFMGTGPKYRSSFPNLLMMNMGHIESNNLEFEVLKFSAQAELDALALKQISDLLNKDISWSRLRQLSQYHAVYPYLHQSFTTLGSDRIPFEILDWLRRMVHATAAHNLLLVKELGRISSLLMDENIPCLAFKGPVFAHMAYRNLGLRPCTDLDILVSQKDFEKVEDILQEDGYRPFAKVQNLSKTRKALHLYLAQQQPFARNRLFALDVHRSIMPPGYHYDVDFETLLGRSQQISIGDVKVCSFAPEDMLQILCYHGVKNRWERLKHICDVAELIRAKPDLDWDTVIERAEATRGMRILGLGLYLAHQVLDAQLPPEVLKQVATDKQAIRWGAWVIARLPEQMQLGMASYAERVRFHLKLQDTIFDKVRYGIYSLLRQIDG